MSASTRTSTPRKRKISGDDLPPRSVTKTRSKNAPAPNPPLVPFPTPPATRNRKDKLPTVPVQPNFPSLTPPGTPRSSGSGTVDNSISQPIASSSKAAGTNRLPPHLDTLLRLHNAFNLALSLHVATRPPVLPPHPPSATSVDLPNLTNFASIKDTVERTSGRRFTTTDMARLAWVWSWDGQALPSDKSFTLSQSHAKGKNKMLEDEADNPFLVKDSGSTPATSLIQVGGLSYLITPTRTLDPASGRRIHTYGIGIELELKVGETRQVLARGAEGGLGNRGQGGGMGAIGRWSNNGEMREDVVRSRLEKWVELNGGYEPPSARMSLLPTPSTSESQRSSIPPIPILPLPHLPSSTLSPAVNLFSSPSSLETSPGLSTTPRKPTLGAALVLDEPEAEVKGKISRTGSVEDRRKAMMDRIKARSGKGGPVATLGSSAGQLGSIRPTMSASETQDELKRRSTLSRLEGVAEAVWMMFSAPSPGPSTLPTPPRGRRRAIPMAEVADVIVKSSKTPISTAEATTSLELLTELCPYFLTIKTVARKQWLEMPPAVQQSCPSPGSASSSLLQAAAGMSPSRSSTGALSGMARATGLSSSPLGPSRSAVDLGEAINLDASPRVYSSPSRGMLAEPTSPTPTRRKLPPHGETTPTGLRTGMGALSHPVSPTPTRMAGTQLAGPASPGKIRRVGGLREVRERIRRELGE